MMNSGAPNGPKNKDQMHPQDMRNLFIFFAAAALLYFAYDAFILKPQSAALQAQVQAQKELAAAVNSEVGIVKDTPVELRDRKEIIAETGGRIEFDNGEVFGTLSLQGGSLDDVSLHEYFKTLEDKENVNVLSPRGSKFSRTVEYGWISNDNIRAPNGKTQWQVLGTNTKLTQTTPVTLYWDNGQGLIFERKLELDEHYMFKITQRVTNNSETAATLYPYGLLAQKGVPPDYQATWISHEGPIGFIGEELFTDGYKAMRKQPKQSFTAAQGWLGFTDKYWLSAFIPPQGQNVKYSYTYAGDQKDPANTGLYQADFLGDAIAVPVGGSAEVETHLFVGAKEVLKLEDYQKALDIPKFDLAVDFGWFWFMTKPFFFALHYLGLLVGNMGVAIIILTIILRGLTFPLTNISYRSFAKMKKVGPQVAALREKYGDDKQGMQQELIKMYQKEQVNPMSGCFPIILQIPIFFALYKTFFVTIEIRHAPFFGWIHDLSAPDPTSIFNLFGLIPWNPPAILIIGVWPCMMLLAMVIQKKLNPPPQDPIQRDIANYMPFLFAFIMSKFAAGLVVYWTFSAFIGILQQMFIMKSLNVPIHLFGEKDDPPPTEGVHPLAEMAEQEIEHALFDDEPAKPISAPKPKKSKKKKK